MGRTQPNKEANLLDYIPVQTVESERKEDGTIFLKRPKTQNRLMKTIIRRLGKSLYFKIHLDDFGSFVWERCDGYHRVDQIADNLKQEFGESIEPVYERLGAFIKILAYQKFISYKGLSSNPE